MRDWLFRRPIRRKKEGMQDWLKFSYPELPKNVGKLLVYNRIRVRGRSESDGWMESTSMHLTFSLIPFGFTFRLF